MGGDENQVVESSVAPPLVNCPNCEGLLPLGLGEKTCELCDAVVKVSHDATVNSWLEEKVACPACSKVLVVGVDKRPAKVQCSSCSVQFSVNPKVVKVELGCPACERRLRLKPRPGSREVTCPACKEPFKVTF